MRTLANVRAVFQRELAAFFLSPVAYIVLFLFVLSNGCSFALYANLFSDEEQQISLTLRSLFSFALFWTLPLSPLLTMRVFAEEKRSGTLEVLLTAPVTESEVIWGKFLAVQVFYTLIWATLLLFVLVFAVLGEVDWGPVLAIYIGLFFLGGLTNSLGVLASLATRNQLVAAVLALCGNLFFFLLTLGATLFRDSHELLRVFHYLSFSQHFASEYTRGVVDVRYPIYYLLIMAVFLFLAVRLLEARKWR
jgi:ABC-2 type transport system permease protein